MDTVDQFINLTTECLHNTQNVVKDLVKVEYTYIPVPSFIQILYSAFPDRNCEEYRILDTGTGNEINRIFRHEGENKPFFIYIPFKGKEYIITSTVPGAFSIVCCTDDKTYDRSLEINEKRAIPIKASAHIRSNYKNEDDYVSITFLCKFVGESDVEYKNITIKLHNMCTCEMFSNMIVENAELSEEN